MVSVRSSRGRPRFRWGRLGVGSSESKSGDEGDSRLRLRGERVDEVGDEVGDEAFSGASPQREGVLEETCAFGEKQAVSNGAADSGSKEKPNESCSSLPNGAASDGCREVEYELVLLLGVVLDAAMPAAGNVGLKWLCSLGKAGDTAADARAWLKNESSEYSGDVV